MATDRILQGLITIIEGPIANLETISQRVEEERDEYSHLDREELARRIVKKYAVRNGLWGAATSVGGLAVLPIAVPANVVAAWRIQAEMTVAIACAMGRAHNTDLQRDVLLVMMGDSHMRVLRRAGVKGVNYMTWKVVDKYVTREVMQKIWKVVGRRVITKAGEKSILSFARMVPLVGAGAGFAVDWAASRAVGAAAIRMYR